MQHDVALYIKYTKYSINNGLAQEKVNKLKSFGAKVYKS